MSATTVFKNFGHAIAVGARDFIKFSQELPSIMAKAQVDETAVALVATAINPQAGQIIDLSWHVLGDVAAAIEKGGAAAQTTQQTGSLNVELSLETIAAVKLAADFIKATLGAKGLSAPAVK